jgi:hypothetical protein
MCGKSSRFPNTRPKWMLTHPYSGNLMCVESILGLNLDFFDKIYFTILEKHENQYSIVEGLKRNLIDLNISEKSNITILERETNSQSETVYLTVKKNNIDGFIFIKDSDGFFEVTIDSIENQICFSDINKIQKVNSNKSYLKIDKNGYVSNIIEKKVISSFFSVGGYSFKSAGKFCEVFEKIKNYEGECFVSNVIYEILLDGDMFKSLETNNFIDWGTFSDWMDYCKDFSTLFIDIDGTLISNTSQYVFPYIGNGSPLINNIEKINELFKTGKSKIILTTSRREKFRNQTILELKEHNINYHELIMNLPHSKRILINDFSNTNIYPSAVAINIERNSDNLKNYF